MAILIVCCLTNLELQLTTTKRPPTERHFCVPQPCSLLQYRSRCPGAGDQRN